MNITDFERFQALEERISKLEKKVDNLLKEIQLIKPFFDYTSDQSLIHKRSK
jgi:hypothetical protein